MHTWVERVVGKEWVGGATLAVANQMGEAGGEKPGVTGMAWHGMEDNRQRRSKVRQ